MSDVVSWNLQLSVKEGRLDAAKSLMSEMVQGTSEESGTLSYEWFLSADGSACHTYERFSDSAAALHHLGNFGERFAGRFLECFTPTALYVYGEPSEDVRGVLDGFGAAYLGTLGGFSR